ncbi:pickpocket protein 19 [Plutella xylostella]|uniref:pickpocket protein 19 n=1 Tax=Plutella xylostella TaxID=51655 RepID=UPI0020328035|nr:pickpocket protein 19 [Plutella xylostella]
MAKVESDSIWRYLCKKVINKLNDFGDKSCLHGVGYVFSTTYIPFVTRLFWLLMLLLCGYGASMVLVSVLTMFSAGAVSFSVETTYLDWDTPFPAVTVCESNKNVKNRIIKHLAEPAKTLNAKNITAQLKQFYEDVGYWQSGFCAQCTKCTYNVTCVRDIQATVSDIRMTCDEIFEPQCWWGEEAFPCCDRFLPVETEYGTCFAFNSRLARGALDVIKLNRHTGLKTLQFSATQAILMRAHSPSDVVTTYSEMYSVPLDANVTLVLKAESTVSDISVQAIPPELRGCFMSWEVPPAAEYWPFHRYKYDACIWYCRAMAQVQLCNCTHHFEPKMVGVRTCDVDGLACLTIKKNHLDSTNFTCFCPMACDEVTYKVMHRFYNRGPKENLPSMNKVLLAELPTLRVRRHAIRDMLSFVVDIGGVGGVFFGASVLSILEIVYLFCIRRQ